MNILLETIVRRVFDRIDERARRPAIYRHAGGGLMSTIATRGILSLALRWPALAVILILSVLAARVVSAGRTNRTTSPVPRVRDRSLRALTEPFRRDM